MTKYYKIDDSSFLETFFFNSIFKILEVSSIYITTSDDIYFLVMKFIRL